MILIFLQCSHPEVFCKKGALRNFGKFTGKDLFQSLFFNKVAEDSQENTCVRVSFFNKVAGLSLQLY